MTGNAKDRRRARRLADREGRLIRWRPPEERWVWTTPALTITIGDADEPLPRDDEGNIVWPALPDGTVLKPVLTIETTAGNISELGNKFWCGGEPSRECACDVCMYEAWKGPEEP